MIKKIKEGFLIGLGIFLFFSIIFGIVFAVGFHNADEIFGGTFTGNFIFDDNVTFNGEVQGIAQSLDVPFMQVQHQTGPNVDAGSLASGAWRTRPLTHEIYNSIDGASLSSYQITLPAGTYYIEAYATGFAVLNHIAKIRDITNSVDLLRGSSERSHTTYIHNTKSIISGRIILASPTVIELQHRSENTRNNDGMGAATTNLGINELWAEVNIWKLN